MHYQICEIKLEKSEKIFLQIHFTPKGSVSSFKKGRVVTVISTWIYNEDRYLILVSIYAPIYCDLIFEPSPWLFLDMRILLHASFHNNDDP